VNNFLYLLIQTILNCGGPRIGGQPGELQD